jgi:hypothetical protein
MPARTRRRKRRRLMIPKGYDLAFLVAVALLALLLIGAAAH